MGRDASTTLAWADGDYIFRLGWGELIKLQEACDAGPYVVLQRLSAGTWRMEDISTTIRLALIGGGTVPEKALKLVRDYVETRPPLENTMLARAILMVALLGPSDEEPGKAPAAPTTEML
ncbi:MAG: gene transfer agent family protein [Devosia sp.]